MHGATMRTEFIPLWHEFKKHVAKRFGLFLSQPFTLISAYSFIVESADKISNCGSSVPPESVSPIVLRLRPSLMWWAELCRHQHGHPFDHFRTLWTIFWYVAFSLRHHHAPLSTGGEFLEGKLLGRDSCPATTSDSRLSSLNISRVIGNCLRRTPHFPPAQLSKHQAHPRSLPPPYSQIFRLFPSHSQTNPLVQQIGNYTPVDLTNSYKNTVWT